MADLLQFEKEFQCSDLATSAFLKRQLYKRNTPHSTSRAHSTVRGRRSSGGHVEDFILFIQLLPVAETALDRLAVGRVALNIGDQDALVGVVPELLLQGEMGSATIPDTLYHRALNRDWRY